MNGKSDETDITADGAYLNSIIYARNGDFDRSIRFVKSYSNEFKLQNRSTKDFEFKNYQKMIDFKNSLTKKLI